VYLRYGFAYGGTVTILLAGHRFCSALLLTAYRDQRRSAGQSGDKRHLNSPCASFALSAGQLALSSGSLIPLSLNQHLEDLAFGIDGAPEVHPPTANPNEHFVQVPLTVRFQTPRPQPACNCWSEGENPAPDSLVGYSESTLGQELLNIAVAEGEAQVEPDRTLNDVVREAVAKVGA
jgi:hypothetical protein